MRSMSNDHGALPLVSLRRGDMVSAMNITRGLVLAETVRLALGPWQRTRGLLGGPPLVAGEAMVLRPCRAVHTCFMGYSIDVLFVDDEGEVVGLDTMRPWRFSAIHGAALATLELPAGVVATTGTEVGDRVAFRARV
jgi:uncharacterized membrane protein (UPF0127 family)